MMFVVFIVLCMASGCDGDTQGGANGGGDSDANGADGSTTTEAVIVINEVVPNGEPTDWIELSNQGETTVDIGGWSITDDDPTHVFFIPAGTLIDPGGYITFERDAADSFTFGLGSADRVLLYDGGSQADAVQWEDGDVPASTSFGRMPDGVGDFMTLTAPTPGGVNQANLPMSCGDGTLDYNEVCDTDQFGGLDCTDYGLNNGTLTCDSECQVIGSDGCDPLLHTVFINEVTSDANDEIEIYNPSDVSVDMTYWTVSDENPESDNGTFLLYPGGGWSVPPMGYLVLKKGLDHLFGLGNSDTVRLTNDDGALVDLVSWAKKEATPSFCRLPDGGDVMQTCESASFGSSNGGN